MKHNATRRFGSGRNVKSVASINAGRGPGDEVDVPARAGAEPRKILNFRLFEPLKQTLEGVKTFANLIKNLKNHKIKLE